ncbi:hypothetical protein JAAARDRAFT_197852 [Jaapia argillacea MUCL 33604]|uniref:Uncharacterized protein n=1 Tax=Jaapia argillacea MUCL 33604 TaxID=933084 RepID=A0A067PE86_9AGAM|nr:hypothetical protein JAAARDRAFT_197852 [Jaapia argillacea MUCL 33604]
MAHSNRKGRKAGNKGNFHGERLKLLPSFLDEYLHAAQAKKTPEFWPQIWAAYWAKFLWRVALSEEPQPDEGGAMLSHEAMMLEEIVQKAEVVQRINMMIKLWFQWKKATSTKLEKNPWAPLLTLIRKKAKKPSRLLPGWQYYMLKNNKAVRDAFDEHWPVAGKLAEQRVAYQNTIAQELFAKETPEVRRVYEEEAMDLHKSAKKEFHRGSLPDAPTDTESINKARARAAGIIQPLLQLVCEYTGSVGTLFLGAPPRSANEECFVKVYIGESGGQYSVD